MTASFDKQVSNRVRAEYEEMPGMRLKLEQMQRLFGLERSVCLRLLEALVVKEIFMRPSGWHVRTRPGSSTELSTIRHELSHSNKPKGRTPQDTCFAPSARKNAADNRLNLEWHTVAADARQTQ